MCNYAEMVSILVSEKELAHEMADIMSAAMVDVSYYGMKNPQETEIIFSILLGAIRRESLERVAGICVEACRSIFLLGAGSNIDLKRLRFLHYIARRCAPNKPSKKIIQKALAVGNGKPVRDRQGNVFRVVEDSEWEQVSKTTDVSKITDSEWRLTSGMIDVMAWAMEKMSPHGMGNFPTKGVLLSVMLCIPEIESFEKVAKICVDACKEVTGLEKRIGATYDQLQFLEYAARVYACRQASEKICLQKDYT